MKIKSLTTKIMSAIVLMSIVIGGLSASAAENTLAFEEYVKIPNKYYSTNIVNYFEICLY